MKNKNMMVFGPESMLGSRLVESLRKRGYQVFTCGRSTNFDVFLDLETGLNQNTFNNIDIDCFFHCAASFGDDSWEGSVKNERINALGSFHVAKLAVALKCRHLIYSGSIFSYLLNNFPINSYGASKLRGEDILEWCLIRNNIKFTSLRFTQLYDEYGKCCLHQKWFGRIVAYAYNGKILRLPPGDARRNFLYIKDAVELMIIIAEKTITGRHPVTHPCSFTNKEIADYAYSVFNNGGSVEIAEEKKQFKEFYIPDSTKFYNNISWYPRFDIKKGLSIIRDIDTGGFFGPKDVC
ncbi:MAG: NAD(P)-dependent oxidoreductase [Desulfobacula sp.]|nr:NAD(P)-dependent oxidoreductase [Desulfobacula sp.]